MILFFERSPNGTDGWTVIKTFTKGTYEATDDFTDKIEEEPSASTAYYYRAYYKNEYGQGPYSEIKSDKTGKVNVEIVKIDSVSCVPGMMKAEIDVAEDVNDFCTNDILSSGITAKNIMIIKLIQVCIVI